MGSPPDYCINGAVIHVHTQYMRCWCCCAQSYDRMMSLLERCPVTKVGSCVCARARVCVTVIVMHSMWWLCLHQLRFFYLWQSIAGITYQELVRIHSEWKLECKQRLQNGNFHDSQHLTDLCNVCATNHTVILLTPLLHALCSKPPIPHHHTSPSTLPSPASTTPHFPSPHLSTHPSPLFLSFHIIPPHTYLPLPLPPPPLLSPYTSSPIEQIPVFYVVSSALFLLLPCIEDVHDITAHTPERALPCVHHTLISNTHN